MAGMTLAEAEAGLAAWIQASINVAAGRSHTMGNRSLTFEDGEEIRNMIDYYEAKVANLNRGGRAIKGVTPC